MILFCWMFFTKKKPKTRKKRNELKSRNQQKTKSLIFSYRIAEQLKEDFLNVKKEFVLNQKKQNIHHFKNRINVCMSHHVHPYKSLNIIIIIFGMSTFSFVRSLFVNVFFFCAKQNKTKDFLR